MRSPLPRHLHRVLQAASGATASRVSTPTILERFEVAGLLAERYSTTSSNCCGDRASGSRGRSVYEIVTSFLFYSGISTKVVVTLVVKRTFHRGNVECVTYLVDVRRVRQKKAE